MRSPSGSTPDRRPSDVGPATVPARTEVDLPDTEDDARSVSARAALPTRLTDRYHLGALLGEGGMGEVLECRDGILDRTVALKIVRRDRQAPQLDARFVAEACVQAQLEHPCVVPVYDVDRDAQGFPFFTMRKVDGVTLDQVLARRRAGDPATAVAFTRHRLLTAFAQVCLTVDYAHARGVLHRDLKPANVMFGDFGEVYVLDWGLAKLTLAAPAPAPLRDDGTRPGGERTHVGAALGTPAYMPPEQFGDGALDERADVFSLGALLFEILTLEPLFDEAAVATRVSRQSMTWDARPSVRAPRQHIAPELDRICVRATAEAMDKRYSSARALHDLIEAYLGGERDVELRKSLASSHFARAEEARGNDRDLALREAHRALALAPDDPRGLALLVDLLQTTPAASAKAREETVSEGVERLRRSQSLGAFLLAMPWVTVYPVLWFLRGVTDARMAIVPPLAWTVATIAIMIDRRQASQERVSYPTYAIFTAVACASVLFGPLFIVPALAVTLVTNHVLISALRLRTLAIALACAAVIVPTALAWAGVHDIYRFENETTFAVKTVFRTVHTFNVGIVLTIVDVLMLVSAAVFASRFRDEIEHARLQNTLFVWQLSKLLPERAVLAVREAAIETEAARPAQDSVEQLLDTEIDVAPSRSSSSSSIVSTPSGDVEGGLSLEALAGPRYEMLEPLTAAEMVSCRDRLVGRDVAMRRLLPSHPASADVEQRFEQEALLQARLDHPGIPPVYDLGRDDRGPWFTTKLVKGVSLAELLAGHDADELAPPAAEASGLSPRRHRHLAAFAQVCLTLDFAHAHGIVHSALDPSRIVLGEFGEVYVLGWGHAVTRAYEDAGPPPAAAASATAYAAPERAAGERIDPRSDVFSLGAILFELMCGEPLFGGDEGLRRVLGKYDARPSARVGMATPIAPELDDICAKACAYAPPDRFASARDLHDAITALMSHDRDEVMRRALAAERMARATKSAEHAIASHDEASRTDALREIGRALALLSDRAPALRLLERLMAVPPSPLPAIVVRDIAAQTWAVSRRAVPATTKVLTAAGVAVFLLVSLLAGVRDPFAAVAIAVAWGCTAAAVFAEHSLVRSRPRFPWAVVSGLVAAATTSLLFGPYILGPTAALAMTIGYVLGGRVEQRRAVVLLGCVAIVLPAALTWARVLDVFELAPTASPLTVLLRGAIHHPPNVLFGGLMAANVTAVLVAGTYAARFRDTLIAIEAENRAKVMALSRLLS